MNILIGIIAAVVCVIAGYAIRMIMSRVAADSTEKNAEQLGPDHAARRGD